MIKEKFQKTIQINFIKINGLNFKKQFFWVIIVIKMNGYLRIDADERWTKGF